jgi:hypothetical protein
MLAPLLWGLVGCGASGEVCPRPIATPPAVNQPGSTAIALDSADIVGWAKEVVSVAFGDAVDDEWQDASRALGTAQGAPDEVVSLGRGGEITLRFSPAIANGDGADFAVFENGLNDHFLELAFVEVSSDGEHFVRFPSRYLGTVPVGAYAGQDTTLIGGLAGKYRIGHGTPFDLEDLVCLPEVTNGLVDTAAVEYVRIVDIIGDGTSLDSGGRPIYDPYPTVGSAGFDLDGVAALHVAE